MSISTHSPHNYSHTSCTSNSIAICNVMILSITATAVATLVPGHGQDSHACSWLIAAAVMASSGTTIDTLLMYIILLGTSVYVHIIL